MSVHPSLRSGKSKKHKSVLKRLEKILHLQKEDKWKEDDSVFGLPKVKVTKIKIKKEKTKAAETAEGTAAPAAAAGAETKPPAAGQAQAKTEAAKKPAEKK